MKHLRFDGAKYHDLRGEMDVKMQENVCRWEIWRRTRKGRRVRQ